MDRAERVTSRSGLASALEIRRGDLVALVGAGGKTSLMYRLAAELRADGFRVAAATTTKITPPGPDEAPVLLCDERYDGLVERLRRRSALCVLGRKVLENGKVQGIPPEWCGQLIADGEVDALVVEADGSARKPLKAPEEWEPVVPPGTTAFVALAGLSVLGKPLDDAAVFRAARVAAVTGYSSGAAVSEELLVRLFRAPEGLLRGRPAGARTYGFLNQADDAEAAAAGRRIAREVLLGGEYDRVLGGALREESPLKFVLGHSDPVEAPRRLG